VCMRRLTFGPFDGEGDDEELEKWLESELYDYMPGISDPYFLFKSAVYSQRNSQRDLCMEKSEDRGIITFIQKLYLCLKKEKSFLYAL